MLWTKWTIFLLLFSDISQTTTSIRIRKISTAAVIRRDYLNSYHGWCLSTSSMSYGRNTDCVLQLIFLSEHAHNWNGGQANSRESTTAWGAKALMERWQSPGGGEMLLEGPNAGETGSGLGTLIQEQIADEFGKTCQQEYFLVLKVNTSSKFT